MLSVRYIGLGPVLHPLRGVRRMPHGIFYSAPSAYASLACSLSGQSAIQAEVNPLESKSLFHILLSVMSKPYASAALFQYAHLIPSFFMAVTIGTGKSNF